MYPYDLEVEVSPPEWGKTSLGRVYEGEAIVRARVTKEGNNVAGVRLLLHSQTKGVGWKTASGALEQNLDVRTDRYGRYEAILSYAGGYKVAKIFICAHARNLNNYAGISSHKSKTILFGSPKKILFDWITVLLFYGFWIWVFLRNGPYMMATFAPILFLMNFYLHREKNQKKILWEGLRIKQLCGFFLCTVGLLWITVWMEKTTILFLSILLLFGMRNRIGWWDEATLWVCTNWCIMENVKEYRDLLSLCTNSNVGWYVTSVVLMGCFPVGFLGVQTLGIVWFLIRPGGVLIPGITGLCLGLQIFNWWIIRRKCV